MACCRLSLGAALLVSSIAQAGLALVSAAGSTGSASGDGFAAFAVAVESLDVATFGMVHFVLR